MGTSLARHSELKVSTHSQTIPEQRKRARNQNVINHSKALLQIKKFRIQGCYKHFCIVSLNSMFQEDYLKACDAVITERWPSCPNMG